jgi:hypothetical protein
MVDESAEIDISSTAEDGRIVSGRYRVAAGVIHVTLSDGSATETQLGNTPAPTLAKILLQELDRKKHSVS